MGDQLQVPLDRLDQLWRDLCLVSAGFSSVEADCDGLADAVGHAGLARKVGEFESGWSVQRTKLTTSLDALWKQARTTHDAFVQTDAELARALD